MFDAKEISASSFAEVPEARRLDALNRQLAYAAARSPYYKETLGALAPLPSLDALSGLPFLDAEILRTQERRLVCVPGSEVARIVSLRSSGTTGAPKRLFFTRGDLERTVDFFAEGMGWMTAPGDAVAVLMPCSAPDGIGDLLCRALRRLGAEPLPLGVPSDPAAACAALTDARPAVLVGFPWLIRLLALLRPSLRPRAALLSADYIPATLPALLRAQWGCAAPAHFGMTETGYGCAVEHPCAPGMVLRADELIAEIVDPDSGAPLPPGRSGELVLTTLRREAMPLVRFRTGDRAVMDGDGRIRRVFGRLGVPEAFYALQDALCALPWLYDYAQRDGALEVLASEDAPPDAEALLSALSGVGSVALRRASPEEAALLHEGKRTR